MTHEWLSGSIRTLYLAEKIKRAREMIFNLKTLKHFALQWRAKSSKWTHAKILNIVSKKNCNKTGELGLYSFFIVGIWQDKINQRGASRRLRPGICIFHCYHPLIFSQSGELKKSLYLTWQIRERAVLLSNC